MPEIKINKTGGSGGGGGGGLTVSSTGYWRTPLIPTNNPAPGNVVFWGYSGPEHPTAAQDGYAYASPWSIETITGTDITTETDITQSWWFSGPDRGNIFIQGPGVVLVTVTIRLIGLVAATDKPIAYVAMYDGTTLLSQIYLTNVTGTDRYSGSGFLSMDSSVHSLELLVELWDAVSANVGSFGELNVVVLN